MDLSGVDANSEELAAKPDGSSFPILSAHFSFESCIVPDIDIGKTKSTKNKTMKMQTN
jgi:hypothetical protein